MSRDLYSDGGYGMYQQPLPDVSIKQRDITNLWLFTIALILLSLLIVTAAVYHRLGDIRVNVSIPGQVVNDAATPDPVAPA